MQSAARWHSTGSDSRHVPHFETAVEWWRHECLAGDRTDGHRRHAMKVTAETDQTRAPVHVPHLQRPGANGHDSNICVCFKYIQFSKQHTKCIGGWKQQTTMMYVVLHIHISMIFFCVSKMVFFKLHLVKCCWRVWYMNCRCCLSCKSTMLFGDINYWILNWVQLFLMRYYLFVF